jgi:integration host factor subunit beta
MNKEQFVKYMAENIDCDGHTAEIIIDLFAEHIYLAISEGYEVDISSLGKFSVKDIPIRKNLQQINSMAKDIPIKKQPYFVPADNLKIACNY